MKQFKRCITLSALFLAVVIAQAKAAHLIILSGQSNMARMNLQRVFIPEIEDYYGKENVAIAKEAWSGQPIRRWYKGWQPSEKENPDKVGDLYKRVVRRIKSTVGRRDIESVTFIWMQGETDAKRKLSKRWEASFYGVVDQLKADLGVDDMNIIVGRLSDHKVGKRHWDAIRENPNEIGNSGENRAWVDTDDLNDAVMVKGKLKENDLHYSEEGYDILAMRYVEQVKRMVPNE